jgi:hypothetical protein
MGLMLLLWLWLWLWLWLKLLLLLLALYGSRPVGGCVLVATVTVVTVDTVW